MKTLSKAILLILISVEIYAQNNYPVVGQPCPEFTFNEVHYYSENKLSLSSLKGKRIILDFFTTGCSACFQSFPKVNELRHRFGNEVEIILVGRDDNIVRSVYKKFQQHYNLELPVAFDSTIFAQFGIYSVPHIVFIDESGVVKAVTSSSEFTADNIAKFIEGDPLDLYVKSNSFETKDEPSLNLKKPLLMNGNGGVDSVFLFRSVLSRWRPQSKAFLYPDLVSDRNCEVLQGLGVPLRSLYGLAFLEKPCRLPQSSGYAEWLWNPILEVKDSSDFVYNKKTGEGLYTLSVIIPKGKASPELSRKFLQLYLQATFGYDAIVESRKMPYWRLTVDKKKRKELKSKGGQPKTEYVDGYLGIRFINQPISSLVDLLWSYHQSQPPFVDRTGIEGNIDISLDVILHDFEALKTELEKKGIFLERGEKPMKVIVVRDRNSS